MDDPRGRSPAPLPRAALSRLLRTPGWFALLTAGIALLTAAVVAPVLFLRAAADASLRTELQTVEADAFASTSSGLRATWGGVLASEDRRTVVQTLQALPGFGRPTVSALGIATSAGARGTTAVVSAGNRLAGATLYYRDGAIGALDPDGVSPAGVWLDQEVAAELQVRPGDAVAVGLDRASAPGPGTRARTVVAGVFDRSPGSALPAAATVDAALARRDLPWSPDRPGDGTPLALVDAETFGRLALAIGEKPLWTADLTLAPGLSPDAAQRASRSVTALASRAFDENSVIAGATAHAKPEPTRLLVASGLPDIVVRSRATTADSGDQAAAFVGAGIGLGAVVVCAAAALLGRSRRRELDLMAGLGLRPREIAWLAALEAVTSVVAGTMGGAALAWGAVTAFGPPGAFRSGASHDVAVRVGVAAAFALVLIAGCAAVSSWLADRRTTGGLHVARRRVPWQPVLLVATLVSGIAVAGTPVGARPANPLAAVFPVLLAAGVSLVVLTLLRSVRLLPGMRGLRALRGSLGSPRWLAGQRSAVVARETAAVALTLSIGLAVLGYAVAVQRGVTEGVDDKVAAAVGARTVVDLGAQLKHPPPRGLPTSPLSDSTIVWRQQVTLPPLFGDQPLIAVDSATFAAIADWGSSGALDSGRAALHRLRGGRDRTVLPVVMVGPGYFPGDLGEISVTAGWSVPFQVVAVVPAFPGSASSRTDVAVLVDARRLFRMIPGYDPTVERTPTSSVEPEIGGFSAVLWSSRSSTSVAAGLSRAGLEPGRTLLRDGVRTQSRLLAAGWSSGYVVALGVGVVLMAAAAVLLLSVRLADRDRVSDVLLARMGFTAHDLAAARTWEVVSVVGSALVAGLAAVVAMTSVPSMVEPDVSLPPSTRPLSGVVDVVLMLGVAATIVLGCALLGRRRTGRVANAEVLRGDA